MLLLATPIVIGVFAALISAVYRSAAVGVSLVLLFFVWRASGLPEPTLPIGPVADILPNDIVFTALVCAGTIHMFRRDGLDLLHWIWLAFGAIVFLALVRGVLAYGPAPAAEIRAMFYTFGGIFYLLMYPLDRGDRNRIAKSVLVAGLGISALVIYVLATEGLGAFVIATRFWGIHEGREFHAYHAMLVLTASLISIYLWRNSHSPTVWKFAFYVLVPCVVAIQFRSVWVVAIVIFTLVFVFERQLRAPMFFVGSLGGALVVILGAIFFGDVAAEFVDSVFGAAERGLSADSTLTWRIEGWVILLADVYAQEFGLIDQLIGEPAGSASFLDYKGTPLYLWPHNGYILFLLRTGAIGLALNLAFLAIVAIRLLRLPPSDPEEYLPGSLLFFWIAGLLVFYWAFHSNFDQTILLGVAGNLALAARPARAPAAEGAKRPATA